MGFENRFGLTYLGGFEVDKDVVILVNGVCIGMGIAASALEVFSTDETTIYIEIQCRYRTHFLKVEV